MTEKRIELKKTRELGEILSDSFDFIKQEYKPISKLMLRYVVPFLVLYGYAQVYFQVNVLRNIDLTNPETMMSNIGPIYLNIFMFSLFGIFVQSLLISTLYSYIDAYTQNTYKEPDISEISAKLFNNSLLTLGASLVYSIIFMFGLFLFIIPGFYFANTLSLTVIALIIEKKGISNALSKSWSLVSKNWWGTFAVLLVGVIIVWVGGFILSIPPLIMGIGNLENITDPGLNYWIIMIIVSSISALLWLIPYTFIALQYFNLTEKYKTELPDF